MRIRNRPGFTLIELTAGLALAGIVFASMLMLVDQLRDGRDRLLAQARRDNARANGVNVLRALLTRAEARSDTSERFIGNQLGAEFFTWCDVPAGWLERCTASLFIERGNDTTHVRAVLSSGERLELITTLWPVEFRYFDSTSEGEHWVSGWGRSTALPAGVAILTPHDTLTVRVGGRG